MNGLGWLFVFGMAAALWVDLGIARDSWRRGQIALAALSSVAAVCAVVGLAFSGAVLLNGGVS